MLAFQSLIAMKILFLYLNEKILVLLIFKTDNHWSLTIHHITSLLPSDFSATSVPSLGVLHMYRFISFPFVSILFKIFAPEFISAIGM